jgi:hypothetical protein
MQANQAFTVPAGAGAYAPEVLYLNPDNQPGTMPDIIGRLSVNVISLPAGAQLELDLLKPGGNPKNAGDWRIAAKAFAAAGLAALVEIANIMGGRIRAKSGGTAGAAEADVAWQRTADQ